MVKEEGARVFKLGGAIDDNPACGTSSRDLLREKLRSRRLLFVQDRMWKVKFTPLCVLCGAE
jgi:hypothetical protein